MEGCDREYKDGIREILCCFQAGKTQASTHLSVSGFNTLNSIFVLVSVCLCCERNGKNEWDLLRKIRGFSWYFGGC